MLNNDSRRQRPELELVNLEQAAALLEVPADTIVSWIQDGLVDFVVPITDPKNHSFTQSQLGVLAHFKKYPDIPKDAWVFGEMTMEDLDEVHREIISERPFNYK